MNRDGQLPADARQRGILTVARTLLETREPAYLTIRHPRSDAETRANGRAQQFIGTLVAIGRKVDGQRPLCLVLNAQSTGGGVPVVTLRWVEELRRATLNEVSAAIARAEADRARAQTHGRKEAR